LRGDGVGFRLRHAEASEQQSARLLGKSALQGLR